MPGPLDNAIKLSEAIPEEYLPLAEGMTFAITGIVIIHKEKKGDDWKEIRFNGFSLPDGTEFVKYKSSAQAVVRKAEDLLTRACFDSGACKKPVLVRVIGYDGKNGRGLDLEDA